MARTELRVRLGRPSSVAEIKAPKAPRAQQDILRTREMTGAGGAGGLALKLHEILRQAEDCKGASEECGKPMRECL